MSVEDPVNLEKRYDSGASWQWVKCAKGSKQFCTIREEAQGVIPLDV